MFRSLIKSAAAYAVSLTRLDQLAQGSRGWPFVVCYHRVVERFNDHQGLAMPAMEITVAMLERHLDWIGRRYRIVSIDDLAGQFEKPAGAVPIAAITFDDGYSDIYHHAFPLLRRKGIPAAIFAVTSAVGSKEALVHERLYYLIVRAWGRWTAPRKQLEECLRGVDIERLPHGRLPKGVTDPFAASRFLLQGLSHEQVHRTIEALHAEDGDGHAFPSALQPLTWEMLIDMQQAGMTIGSHSRTHAFLPNETSQRVTEEVAASRADLERKLGVEVRSFAYPDGGFNRSIVEAVASAGYHCAFTTCCHQDSEYPWLSIPRTGLWEASCVDPFGRFSASIMSCQAAGALQWAARCSNVHAGGRSPSPPRQEQTT